MSDPVNLSSRLSSLTGTANKTVTFYPDGSFNTIEPRRPSCDCGALTARSWVVFTYLCGACGEEHPA